MLKTLDASFLNARELLFLAVQDAVARNGVVFIETEAVKKRDSN